MVPSAIARRSLSRYHRRVSAWEQARDDVRGARSRCLVALAVAYGCGDPQELPTDVLRAVVVYGREMYDAALEYTHEAVTARPPPPSGAYRETPTRVDVVRRR